MCNGLVGPAVKRVAVPVEDKEVPVVPEEMVAQGAWLVQEVQGDGDVARRRDGQ